MVVVAEEEGGGGVVEEREEGVVEAGEVEGVGVEQKQVAAAAARLQRAKGCSSPRDLRSFVFGQLSTPSTPPSSASARQCLT